jgi:hypothetical protein
MARVCPRAGRDAGNPHAGSLHCPITLVGAAGSVRMPFEDTTAPIEELGAGWLEKSPVRPDAAALGRGDVGLECIDMLAV